MRTARAANAALYVLITALALLVAATRLAPALAGVQAVALTGQSMSGTYEMGTLVYVDPSTPPAVGSVVTFDRNGRLWTHRIISQTHAPESYDIPRYQTKGDNPSLGQDPFLVKPEDIRGTVVASAPYLGYIDLWMKSPPAWVLVIVLAFIFLQSARPKDQNPVLRRLKTYCRPWTPTERRIHDLCTTSATR
jgi:signal peptidase I